MSEDDNIEHRIIDTRVRPPVSVLDGVSDLVIEITPLDDMKYDVGYFKPDGAGGLEVLVLFAGLERACMVVEHVTQIRNHKPKTVEIRSGDQRTPLHPGVVRSIVEGKIEVAQLILRREES